MNKDLLTVIYSGLAGIAFNFFTKNFQKIMERGKYFRNAFNQSHAEAYLELTICGVGVIKKRKFKSAKMIFKENIA